MKITATRLAALALSLTLVTTTKAQTPPASDQGKSEARSGAVAAKGMVVGPSNEPQAGVPVQIEGPLGRTLAITDTNGTWPLYNLPAGNYKAKMLTGSTTKPPPAVMFTVQESSFWQKLSGKFTGTTQNLVVWTPELKTDRTGGVQ